MSDENKLAQEDTRPKPLFKQAPPTLDSMEAGPPLIDPYGDEDEDTGPGCLFWGLVSGIVLIFALAIIGLSATAGWTEGQRIASANGTATSSADIAAQCRALAGDVADGNAILLEARYQYLAVLTPAVPCIADVPVTATAIYLQSIPTETPTPTPTETPGPTEEVSPEPEVSDPLGASSGSATYDLSQLMNDANAQMAVREWEDAIVTLDAIISIDPNYDSATIRTMMLRALREQANTYYQSGELAKGVLLTDRAEDFGLDREDPLRFERDVATLYLDGQRFAGIDATNAIRSLERVIFFSPNYPNGTGRARQLLSQQYVAAGDAWFISGVPCQAVGQYDSALQLFNDPAVSGKRATADQQCQFGTPTPEGFVPTPGDVPPDGSAPESMPTIAPVGQPGT